MDNQCVASIINNTIYQCHSKAMDMRFYWVCNCVSQGDFHVYWCHGCDNLANYFTKHHSPSHHRLMCSCYLLELHHPTPVPHKGVLMNLGPPLIQDTSNSFP